MHDLETITADVQAWVDGTTNNGWLIKDTVETGAGSGDLTTYRSSEDTVVPADVPTLDVTYTSAFTMRHESSDLTINGSDQVTTVTVQGSKDTHTGSKSITVDLLDSSATVISTGSGTLPTTTTYNVGVGLSPFVSYFSVAEVKVTYTDP